MMKKQLLTSAMAVAMLAPTAAAFAADAATVTDGGVIAGQDTNTLSGQMGITGTVRNVDGAAAAGRIEISLPTAVSFVVDQAGNVQTPNNILVENQSQCGVEISIAGFTDSTPNSGITLIDSTTDLTTVGRDHVSLTLEGNVGGATALLHNNTTMGPILELAEVGNAQKASSANLVLSGVAGSKKLVGTDGTTPTGVDADGATDNFTITFQVAKK